MANLYIEYTTLLEVVCVQVVKKYSKFYYHFRSSINHTSLVDNIYIIIYNRNILKKETTIFMKNC